jgi:MscS family membrane protein
MSKRSVKLSSAVLLAASIFWSHPAAARQSHAQPAAPAQGATVSPTDALGLGRETPRGTIIGFIRAAQAEDYDGATQYFELRRRSTSVQSKELAAQLLAILNTGFWGSLDSIPDVAQLPHDHVTFGLRLNGDLFPLQLVRVEDHGAKLWFISSQTLEQVPEVYDSLRFPHLENQLPHYLVKTRLLDMPLWQWLAIVVFAPIALALGWAVAMLVFTAHQWTRRARGLAPFPVQKRRRFGPGALLAATIIHYSFVLLIGTSLLYRWYYRRLILILLSIALYWALTRITYWISCIVWNDLTQRNRIAERSIISLIRRALDVAIFVGIGLFVLSELDANVPAALAGLGIGGLAIGFGAQKTFENLLGGISILTDKAIVVGDPCRIGDQRGVVEDIGLRSTKLRTEERTLVSIPNGTVATATLEKSRWRDKILCKQVVRLRYDLSPDHLRFVLEQLRDVLTRHPKIEQETARVRVLKLGEYAIEVEVYGYILVATYAEYLAAQEELILQIMDTLERTGAAVALSSQTTVVTRDPWSDPEKAAAAQKAVERMRDPGVPGRHHPELAPDIVPRNR